MRRSELLEIIREVLSEQEGGAVGNVTAALGGGEGPPKITRAFSKKGAKTNAAIETAKNFGYTVVKKKKRPYDTQGLSYLDEMQTATPHVFVPDTQMENSDAVKHTEELGYKKVKKSDKKK